MNKYRDPEVVEGRQALSICKFDFDNISQTVDLKLLKAKKRKSEGLNVVYMHMQRWLIKSTMNHYQILHLTSKLKLYTSLAASSFEVTVNVPKYLAVQVCSVSNAIEINIKVTVPVISPLFLMSLMLYSPHSFGHLQAFVQCSWLDCFM